MNAILDLPVLLLILIPGIIAPLLFIGANQIIALRKRKRQYAAEDKAHAVALLEDSK
jgi:hypothetical protein